MLQSSLYGDGIEMLFESLQLSDQLDTVLAADFFLDHRHAREDPMPVLSERFQCRTVVELTHNIRMQPMVAAIGRAAAEARHSMSGGVEGPR